MVVRALYNNSIARDFLADEFILNNYVETGIPNTISYQQLGVSAKKLNLEAHTMANYWRVFGKFQSNTKIEVLFDNSPWNTTEIEPISLNQPV